MQSTSSRVSSLSSLIIGFSIIVSISQVNAFAVSPSFFRQIHVDDDLSGTIDREPFLKRKYGHLPIDIASASFSSNGRVLNGTIWLNDPIYEDRHYEYVDSNITFSMALRDERDSFRDYVVSIYPAPDKTWTKVVYEYEPPREGGETTLKPIVSVYNYSNFFDNGNRYIQLDLDLNSIGLPSSYLVFFEITANKDGSKLNDYTYSRPVPVRLNRLVFNWPEHLRIRAGDELVERISVNSTQLITEQRVTPTDANETDDIRVSFSPPSFQASLDGITKLDLIIRTPPELPVANYTIPIAIDSITGQGIRSNWTQPFIAQVIPASSQLEKVSVSLSRYSFYLSFVPIAVTSIIALSLSRVINTKSSVFTNLSMTDIITIDASVIVGVLFFLTLGGDDLSSGTNMYMGILTASIVYPFALSAIRAVTKGSAEYGIRFMLSGFIYLMISIGLIVFLR